MKPWTIEMTHPLLRATWRHLYAPFAIGRTWLNRVDLSMDASSGSLIAIRSLIRRLRLFSSINPMFFAAEMLPLDFQVKSNCLHTTIQDSIHFFAFLTRFHIRGVLEIKKLIKGVRTNHILNAIFVFENRGMNSHASGN